MPRQCEDPFEVVFPGYRGLGDHEHLCSTAQRRDDRAADARGAVHDDQGMPLLLGDATGLAAHHGDELARVLGRDAQPGVDHGPAPGLRDHPVPAGTVGKIDGLLRTEVRAHPAALAGYGVNTEGVPARSCLVPHDGIVPAQVLAGAAPGAVLLPDHGLAAADELVLRHDLRLQEQVHVRRVHVAVRYDRVLCQHGQRGSQAGLARTTLAADDDKLLYASTLTAHDSLTPRTGALHSVHPSRSRSFPWSPESTSLYGMRPFPDRRP